MSTETELKLQVPPGRAEAVARAVAARSGTTLRLQAVYVDTPGRTLATAGIALRLRREGRRWVQTLKATGSDRLQRLEHNVPRAGAGATPPPLDLALHAGTPAGARLAAALGGGRAAALEPLYRTDVRRLQRRVRAGGTLLELALDRGSIVAGERVLPVCELEIELLQGPPQAVLDQARRWIERHGLWLDVRSKAERGDLLARGSTVAPAALATPPALAGVTERAAGRRAVLAVCAEQVLANASQVASGTHGDEHVHQLRVGLRRLRSALRLFDGERPDDPLAAGAAALFARLGAARDRAAIAAPLQAELAQALQGLGLALAAPALPAAPGGEDPVACVRSAAAQGFLLDLLAALQPPAPPAAPAAADLRDSVVAALQRWHRQVAGAAADFATLDDAARHRLRKRAKRLRYAVEFAAPLFDAKRVRRYLQPLRTLQERLGALNDVAVGLAGYRGEGAANDPATTFALGWLAARRERLLSEVVPALRAVAAAKRFWKKRA